MDAIEACALHGRAESIDQVPCYLIGREREADTARVIAKASKKTLVDRGFDATTCSIGIAPIQFLKKTASDMHKAARSVGRALRPAVA